jgi:hypothetical protein
MIVLEHIFLDHEISIIHIDSYRPNSVSTETRFKSFINHGNHGDSFVEVTIHTVSVLLLVMIYVLCDFVRNIEF